MIQQFTVTTVTNGWLVSFVVGDDEPTLYTVENQEWLQRVFTEFVLSGAEDAIKVLEELINNPV